MDRRARPVTEFYLNLSDEAIYWFLRAHHENMRPVIRAAVVEARKRGGFILEGAALRPEYLSDWSVGDDLVVCLHVDDDALRKRILHASGYSDQPDQVKQAIDAFIERSVRENVAFFESAKQNQLNLVDAMAPSINSSSVERIAALLGLAASDR